MDQGWVEVGLLNAQTRIELWPHETCLDVLKLGFLHSQWITFNPFEDCFFFSSHSH